MRSNCIEHPSNEPLIVIHRWQVEACDGNVCAAAIMSFLEYWHTIKLANRVKATQFNDVAEMHGDERTQDETLYQWHTTEQIREGIFMYADKAIREGIRLLEKKGFVSTHKNPNPRYKFDNTKFFLFSPNAVNEWLKNRYGKNTESNGKNAGWSGGSAGWSGEKPGTIPEITPEITYGDSKTPLYPPQGGESEVIECEFFDLEPEPSFTQPAQSFPSVQQSQPESETGGNLATVPRRQKNLKTEYSESFEQFWDLYPRKEGKAKAFAKWHLTKSVGQQAILDALRWQVEDFLRTGKSFEFFPHGATWLHGRRWEDQRPNPDMQRFVRPRTAAEELRLRNEQAFREAFEEMRREGVIAC